MREGEDGRGLAGAGRTVEKHVGKVGGLEGSFEDGDGVVLGCNIRKALGATDRGLCQLYFM